MRVCGAKPPVADILDKITGAPGGALHHDVGHCFIVCHNALSDLRGTFLHAGYIVGFHGHQTRTNRHPAHVKAAAQRTARWISDLAALVLDGLLRPQPRVQQLLCIGLGDRDRNPHVLAQFLASADIFHTTSQTPSEKSFEGFGYSIFIIIIYNIDK